MNVYGGILSIPSHRLADMHGLVRACVATSRRLNVRSILGTFDIQLPPSVWIMGLWGDSKSRVEEEVTETSPGKVFVCLGWRKLT